MATEVIPGAEEPSNEKENEWEEEEGEEEAAKTTLAVVGKIWTERNVNANALIATMKRVWNPKHGMEANCIEKNIFFFQFHHWRDKAFVMDSQPWHFDHHVLALTDVKVDRSYSEKLRASPWRANKRNIEKGDITSARQLFVTKQQKQKIDVSEIVSDVTEKLQVVTLTPENKEKLVALNIKENAEIEVIEVEGFASKAADECVKGTIAKKSGQHSESFISPSEAPAANTAVPPISPTTLNIIAENTEEGTGSNRKWKRMARRGGKEDSKSVEVLDLKRLRNEMDLDCESGQVGGKKSKSSIPVVQSTDVLAEIGLSQPRREQ
ncbi:hypothetical protein AgCh_033321 [Apium graveolens]